MTKRNRIHAIMEARFAGLLTLWLQSQPKPHPEIATGEVGIILERNPDLLVGADVVLISPEVMAVQPPLMTSMIEGIPTLIVEIASTGETVEYWHQLTTTYKKIGVPVTLIINPYDKTVGIYRPDHPPVTVNETQTLDLNPELPGFVVPVISIFAS